MKTVYFFCSIIILLTSGILLSQEENSRSLIDNPTKFRKYVNDETGTLTQEQINSLLKKLENFDKETSTQIVVYLISSLNGEPLEEVSVRLAEANKIGKKDRNNGVLLLIVKNDRKLRIEVGYGLEGALTDALSSQIIRNEITPSFKNNNYYEGISKGIDAIISVTKGEYKADKKKKESGGLCFGIPIFVIMIFIFVGFSIFISIIRRLMGFGGTMYSGKGRHGGWSNYGGGGFWSGGSGSSGGSSFGGFSGGGGSFGGGGASGSW